MDRDLLSSVIERWRSASMSHHAIDEEAAMYEPAPAQAAPVYAQPLQPAPQPSPLRSSILKKPLDAAATKGAPGLGSRFR